MSEDFEDLLRRWLRERGRADREQLAALAGHVAALPPRRPGPRRSLLLAASLVVLVVATVSMTSPFGQTGNEPAPSASAPATDPSPTTTALATYDGGSFSFRYPVEWRLISEDRHEGPPGSTLEVAIGVGGFDFDCTFEPSGVQISKTCAFPVWEVTDDGVVLAYYEKVILPDSTLSPRPTEEATSVGGRRAAFSTDAASYVWEWRLDATWVIEARFGPDMLKLRQGEVRDLIASWRWTAGVDATPAPARTRPPWAADLTGALDCDGPVQDIGGEAGDFGLIWIEGTASPGFWLDHLDTVDLPLTGWVEDPEVPDTGYAGSARFINEVDGRIKAVILMVGFSPDGGSGRWAIAGYRACPASEFDPRRGTTLGDAPWHDSSGKVDRRARAVNGPGHCGWESTIFLHLDGRTYIRDPLGLFADRTVAPYLADTDLPPDTTSANLTSAGRELFTSPNGDFVWIRAGDVVERWPRATEEIGCA